MVLVTSTRNWCSKKEIPDTTEVNGSDPVLSKYKGNLIPTQQIRGAQKIRSIEF